MKLGDISVSDIAEKLSAEATRLVAGVDVVEPLQGPLAIAALMLAACVEGRICDVSLETMLAAFRASWRDVERAVDSFEQTRANRKPNADSN